MSFHLKLHLKSRKKASECMNEVWWDQVNPTHSERSIPRSFHHFTNKEVKMSGVARTSDDRARRMKTKTTRKDKSDKEKERNRR